MAQQRAVRLAKTLLTKEQLPILEEVVNRHVDEAMTAKDKPRLRELNSIQDDIDAVKAGK